jgi:hypothetical protein
MISAEAMLKEYEGTPFSLAEEITIPCAID